MALTSQISAKPVFGAAPAGYVDLIPNNDGELAFISGSTLTGVFEFLVTDLTYVTDDIPATQDNFLALVKSYMDNTYMPSVFTDATKSYDARYIITNIRLDFDTVGTTSNRGIWVERVWKYFTTIKILVNVD